MGDQTQFLTQEQVDDLSEGAAVIITWGGGNGPHRYTIHRSGGVVIAATEWEVEHDRYDWMKTLGHPTPVGVQRWQTRVSLVPADALLPAPDREATDGD